MRVLITGNMGYIGPVLVRHLRRVLPGATLIGYDAGFFAHCLTRAGALPETLLDVQHFGDTRELPAEVPAFAKALVGDTIRLEETRRYGAPDEDGSRVGTVEVGFGSAPLRLTGTLTLAPTDTGSAVRLDGEVKASVPFIGGKIERITKPPIKRLKQPQHGRRFARHDSEQIPPVAIG